MVNICQQRINILKVTKEHFTEAMEKTLHESKQQIRVITEQSEADIAKITGDRSDTLSGDRIIHNSQINEPIRRLLSTTFESVAAEQERCRVAMMNLRDEMENVIDNLTSILVLDQENYGHLNFLV
jgi:hypothetical protein